MIGWSTGGGAMGFFVKKSMFCTHQIACYRAPPLISSGPPLGFAQHYSSLTDTSVLQFMQRICALPTAADYSIWRLVSLLHWRWGILMLLTMLAVQHRELQKKVLVCQTAAQPQFTCTCCESCPHFQGLRKNDSLNENSTWSCKFSVSFHCRDPHLSASFSQLVVSCGLTVFFLYYQSFCWHDLRLKKIFGSDYGQVLHHG